LILAISIHHQDRVALNLTLDNTQTHRNRTLVSHIAPQSEQINAAYVRWFKRTPTAQRFRASVVHQKDADVYAVQERQLLIDLTA
jgi:hypothetical protein